MCGMTSKAATSETKEITALALSPAIPLKTQSVVSKFSAFSLYRPFRDEWKKWATNMEGRKENECSAPSSINDQQPMKPSSPFNRSPMKRSIPSIYLFIHSGPNLPSKADILTPLKNLHGFFVSWSFFGASMGSMESVQGTIR